MQGANSANAVQGAIANGGAATSLRTVRGARATLRGFGLLAVGALAALLFVSNAEAQAPVGLGTADGFAVLGGSAVTNTGPSVVNGDLGVSPNNAVTGFPPGIVNGTIHAADAVAGQAQSDLTTAYNDAAGRACDVTLTGQDLGGLTLTSGVYCYATSAQLTGTTTLDAQGDPNAVFIFQIGSTLTTASNSTVNLINGAQACNVFWQVGSSAILGTTTTFVGNVLALTSIVANTGATVDGRLLADNGATTLDSNTITRAQCAVPPQPEPEPSPSPSPAPSPAPGPPGDGPAPSPAPGPSPGGDTQGPVVDIGAGGPNNGIPNDECPASNFRLQISASDESGIKNVKVFLDGELIKSTTSGKFSVLIPAESLDAGRHTIRVVARDNAGNKTVKTRKFRRCDAPVLPDFTG